MALRIPNTPPALSELIERYKNELPRLLAMPLPATPYYSYDEVRHHPIPAPLQSVAHETDQWWLRIALERASKFRELPLCDAKGVPFKFFIDDADLKLLHLFDLKGGGTFEVDASFPSTREHEKFLISSLIEESLTSAQVEGAVGTRDEAKKMIAANRAPRSRDERMILNNYQTMGSLKSMKEEPFSIATLLRIHAAISKNTLDTKDAEGRLRGEGDNVCVGDDEGNVYHRPAPAAELEKRLGALCDFANAESEPFIHPVIKAIIIHFWLAYEHPFADGNGRTARALFYWYLLKHEYWIFEYISISAEIRESGNRYARSFLDAETDGNDLNYFLKFQLEILKRAVDRFNAYVRKKQQERKLAASQYAVMETLNERQRAIITRALHKRHERPEFTILSHQRLNKISWETARRDLIRLYHLKLLARKRVGSQFVFYPDADFQIILEQTRRLA